MGAWYIYRQVAMSYLYASCQILNIKYLPDVEGESDPKMTKYTVSFSERGVIGIHPHNDNPIVSTIRCDE